MLSLLIAAAFNPKPFDAVLNDPALKGSVVGAAILDEQGREMYSRNADLRLAPASNQKTLTAVFALDTLGPDTTIQTRFWKTPEGLVVDAPGDPTITRQQLIDARKALAMSEPYRVFVRQAFRVETPPTWEWDDLSFRYAAPVTALSYDRAAFTLFAEDREVRAPEELRINLRRGRMTGAASVQYSRVREAMTVDGALPQERTSLGNFAMPAPDEAASRLLGGMIHEWSQPLPDRPADYTITSPPVREIVARMLKPSDNIIAEHLLLLAAGASSPLPSNPYPVAAARLKDFLVTEVGLDADAVRPIDGSGLSRQNLITAMALAKILHWADNQRFAEEMRTGLAIGGQEGTLRNRLQTVKFAGKTGTINAVSALCGLLHPGEPNVKYLAVVMNGATAPSATLRALQDRFVRELDAQANVHVLQSPTRPVQAGRSSDPHARRLDGYRLY